RLERGIAGQACRIELNLPPHVDGVEELAGFRRRGGACTREQRRHFLEPGVEDGVIDTHELGLAGKPRGGNRLAGRKGPPYTADAQHDRTAERQPQPALPAEARRAKAGHVTLVRSCCFSACRSRASVISRSMSWG